MKSKAGNRVVAFAPAAALLLGGVFAALPMTTYAVDIGTKENLRLDIGRTAQGVAVGDQVYYGGELYRIVANDGSTMTLFMDDSIGNMIYDDYSNDDWSGSDICLYLNNDASGFLSTFTLAEQAAIPNYGTTEVRKGVPKDEIAFIHDYNTEIQKKDLFAKVRSGKVRVLFGSTFKCGAGTNVQDRLIALHDLDCPWRPADVGRALRTDDSYEDRIAIVGIMFLSYLAKIKSITVDIDRYFCYIGFG